MSSNKSSWVDSSNHYWGRDGFVYDHINPHQKPIAGSALPAQITKAASKQTYYTIRFLVDRDRVANAYRTYAYFRWVDDQLDEHLPNQSERITFIQRQQNLVNRCYQQMPVRDQSPEENILVDLIQSDPQADTGLQLYIRHMMAVMVFDAERRGRVISQQELHSYTRHLAVAVTEAMHYFIGHGQYAPHTSERYCAVTGAHITHMLRDMHEDIKAGYINIPREFIEKHHIDIQDVKTEAYQGWVKSRVEQARNCFKVGKAYLQQVENRRCRIAGYAYLARFQSVLDIIAHDDYQLRPNYSEHSSLRGGLQLAASLLSALAT
jgi:phytoene/squalene synthetase